MSNILPTGYTQLEYLQSSGTQYIDTGIVPIENDEIELQNVVCVKSSNNQAIFSAGTGIYQLILLVGISSINAYFKYFASGGAKEIYQNLNTPTNIVVNNTGIYYNSELKITSNYENVVNTNLFLFRRADDTSYATAKIGITKLIRDNTPVRNFIPVKRNSDSVLGMYDLVTDTFFTNAGTGEFIAGPVVYNGYKLSNFTYFKGSTLPVGYLQLEYIESNGTQWIDTGIQADLRNDFAFTGKCGWHHNARGMLLSAYLMSSYPNNLSIELSEDIKFRFYCGATDIFRLDSGAEIGKLYDFTTTYIASTGAVSLSINGSSASGTVPEAGRILNSGTLVLGSDQGHRFPFGIFGPLKFVSNSITKFEYIPAKRISDGVLGMYDLVSNTFLTNAGTGEFVAGPVVYHDSKLTYYQIYNPRVSGYTELEYLESTGTQYIDTGFKPNNMTKTEVVAYVRETAAIGAVRWSDSPTYDSYGWYASSSSGYWFTIYYGRFDDNKYTRITAGFPYKHKLTLTVTPDMVSVMSNDSSYSYQKSITQDTYQSTYNLFLLAFNINGTVTESNAGDTIYSCKIWDNGTLVRNFVPMRRNSDSILGMYDLANSGKNHWDPSLPYVSGYLKADGVVDTNVSKPYYCIDYIEVKPNTKYTYSVTLTAAGTGDGIRICFYDENKNFVGTREGGETTSPTRYHYPITSPANAKYVRISHVATFEAAQLEEGQLETAYEPFPFYTNAGTGTFIAGPMVQRTNITNPIIYI